MARAPLALLGITLGVVLPCRVTASTMHLRGPTSLVAEDSEVKARTCAGAMKVYADGYMRVGCETDISPKSSRLYFSELVCGKQPTCRTKMRKMNPDLCFQFCREYAVQFFAIQGNDCYCMPWYHKRTTKSGQCDWACAGDSSQKCGSADKVSLFEQHLCGDSANEAASALEIADEAEAKAKAVLEAANVTEGKLYGISATWNLGICSASKQNVCDLKGHWETAGHSLNKLEASVKQALYRMSEVTSVLTNLSDVIAAGNASGKVYSQMEATIRTLKTKGVDVGLASNKLELQLKTTTGPLEGKPMEKFAELFQPLVDMSMKGTHAICDLQVFQKFETVAPNDPAVCAAHCLDKGSDCAAFNYQYKDGLMACQLLSKEGLTKPAFLFSIPAFEITNSMIKSINFDSVGCFAKTVFMKENGRGPTKVDVLKKVVKTE